MKIYIASLHVRGLSTALSAALLALRYCSSQRTEDKQLSHGSNMPGHINEGNGHKTIQVSGGIHRRKEALLSSALYLCCSGRKEMVQVMSADCTERMGQISGCVADLADSRPRGRHYSV